MEQVPRSTLHPPPSTLLHQQGDRVHPAHRGGGPGLHGGAAAGGAGEEEAGGHLLTASPLATTPTPEYRTSCYICGCFSSDKSRLESFLYIVTINIKKNPLT